MIEFYSGAAFFLVLIVILIPALILGVMEKSLHGYTLLASLLVLSLVFVKQMDQAAYLLAYLVFEFALIKVYLIERKRYGRQAWIYRFVASLSIAPMVLAKLSETGGLVSLHAFSFIGISYLTFRVIQMIMESYDGLIRDIRAVDYISFILFFPTFSCGPIDRSRRFLEDSNKICSRDQYLNLVGEGIQRLLLGIVYKFVLAALCYEWLGMIAGKQGAVSNIAYAYLYGGYLFFDFAGYSLMVVGSGYFFGMCIPGNFNMPFISSDIKDFWSRWHITLSQWFRDYLFSRFVMLGFQRKWFKNRLTAAAAGFMVNMAVMGLWHGFAVRYFVYGVYHGILLGISEIYQKKSNFYLRNKKKRWYRIAGWFVTMQLVMFGFLIFSGRII